MEKAKQKLYKWKWFSVFSAKYQNKWKIKVSITGNIMEYFHLLTLLCIALYARSTK